MPHFQWHSLKIKYEVHGTGPPILLVHGWAQSSRCWDQLVPALRARHQVVCVDLPGFGGSEKPARFSYSLEALATVLADFIRHLNPARLVLVGHSMGGVVSLLAALAEGSPVAGLVLINTPVQGPARPLQLFRSVVFPEFWFELGKHVELAVRIASLVTIGRGDVKALWAMQDAARASGTAASKTYMRLSRMDLREAARRVRIPTLIVGCEGDRVVPVQAARLLSSCIAGSEVVTLAHTQHMPMVEDPMRLAAIMDPFVHRLQTPAA